MKKCVELQVAAWDFDPLDAMPYHFFIVVREIGGIVFGAFDGDRLVGFLYTLPSLNGHTAPRQLLDMVAVLPDYHNHGIGYQLFIHYVDELKQHCQHHWLEPELEWTFDPWIGSNAHLYLRKLGAAAVAFVPDMYGAMSGINAGLRTDRFVARWTPLDPDTRSHLAHRTPPRRVADLPQNWVGLIEFVDGLPHVRDINLRRDDDMLLLQMPYDFPHLKQHHFDLAMNWQQAVAEVFKHYFALGYQITDYLRWLEQELPYNVYVFQRSIA